jgi:2-keto-4-pentenoate hydratase/2-oxohepta-3-ene-1,7-dioic acid hydratase in catechol pathway
MRIVTIPGLGEIPVGKILGIGTNYALHAAEMGAAVGGDPVVFLKPASALCGEGAIVCAPGPGHAFHHEVELVVAIGRGGSRIPFEGALSHVGGYAVGLDLTLRDLQKEAKRLGRPWALAKGFDTSAPVSAFTAAGEVPDPQRIALSLKVNGILRQSGNTADMVVPVAGLIAFISQFMTLEPGDLIFTGTPAGVGALKPGDILDAEADGVGRLRVTVGLPAPTTPRT